jgi:tetratricopeptide (TPR) repeat protein
VNEEKTTAIMNEGIELTRAGRHLEALAHFEKVKNQGAKSPVWQSYWGLLNGLERGQVAEGRRLCKDAVERLPQRPDLYLNLSRLQAKSQLRGDALDTLRTGLGVLPDEGLLHEALVRFGIRRKPVLSVLPRAHPLNKFLGRIRHALFGFLGKNPILRREGDIPELTEANAGDQGAQ